MNTEDLERRKRISPTRALVIAIALIILLGAILLKQPICNNKPITFIDSLFISTTSVCVTGLTTVVIAEQFTLIGQVVIMMLMQIGGLRTDEFHGIIFNDDGKKD